MDVFVLMIDPESLINQDKGMEMDEVDVLGVFESEAQAVQAIGLRLNDLKSYNGRDDHWSLCHFPDGEDEEPEELLLRRMTLGRLN